MEQANIITSSSNNRGEYGHLIWNKVLFNLQKHIEIKQFKIWLDNTKFSKLTANTLVISVKSNFIREWIINNYFLLIKSEVFKIDETIKKLSFVINEDNETSIGNHIQSDSKVEQNIFSKLNPKFIFENYVVGEGNNIAYKISQDIASQNVTYNNNIFYIHSPVGMGKTHLLQSIASKLVNNAHCRVGYLSAEKFMHNFINAVKNNTLIDLRNNVNKVDIFLIDDIQFICGKESTQREFAITLNSFIELNKPVVIASSLSPDMLELKDERTKSLLISSNTVYIKPFDYALRLKILEFYNAKNSIKFDIKILKLIADKITTNVRELEAALNNLATYLLTSSKEASLGNICNYIQNYMKSSVKKITVAGIINAVSKFYRISKADILSKKRAKKLVLGRQIIAYLAKELTADSLSSIGEKLGNRNHTTILYYLNKLDLSDKNCSLSKDIHLIKNSIV